MKYSRFNEHLGMYEVYQDAKTHPLNADLPVPQLPPLVNGIGVAARTAGRPLPSGARKVGTSWHPVGLIVATTSASSGLGTIADTVRAHPVLALLGAAAMGAGLYYAWNT